MKTTIFHNPRCSKSRQTLALLEQKNIDLNIVEYLKTPPSIDELTNLSSIFSDDAREIMRNGEIKYKELALDREELTNTDLLKAIKQHPILLQRPIVVVGDQARIGRPPESVLDLFEDQ
ncbi:MAG: arsenate reductase [Parasphingorhabdus sp.]|jgi:arsenate reductase